MESPAFVNFLSAYGFSFKPLPAGADLDHAIAPLLAVTLHGLVALVDLHALDLPKPHFNTLSTMVRALEAKGYVAHNSFGSTYQYYPVVSEEEFSRSTLGSVISRYFENSYLGAVSALVEEEKISLGELRSLIDRIENQNR